MHIHIDALRWHLEGQHQDGLAILRQEGVVRIVHRLRHGAALDDAAIDDEGLVLAAALEQRRLGNQPFHHSPFDFARHRQHFAGHLGAVERRDGIEKPAIARGFQDASAIIDEAEGNIRIRQSQFPHHGIDAAGLGALGFQKFLSRRHIIEKVAHFDGGARRRADGLHFRHFAAFHLHHRAFHVVRSAGGNGGAGDGGNAGQRFPAEAQGGDMVNIFHAGNLAGGVANDG